MDAPYEGFAQALIRARIPYLPVHADDLDRQGRELAVLVLPNTGGLSDAQCEAIRQFVARGGSLVATGDSTRFNEWGDPRPDFALADLLHVHAQAPAARRASAASIHTYLRLHPEWRAKVWGPKIGTEPSPDGARHPVLHGFDETDILAFGGRLQPLRVEEGAVVPLTFVPEFPVYPPETAWMRETDTRIPGLVVSEHRRARASPTWRRTWTGDTSANCCPTTATCWPTWCDGPRATAYRWACRAPASSIATFTGNRAG